jgi:hypothetical protein
MRKLIKKILKESDEWDWVKYVKSNQEIAQEIADETKIKNDLLYTPFPPFPFSTVPLSLSATLHLPLFSTRLLSSFTKYCEERYGLSEDDINDVWKRYKKLVKGNINKLIREEMDAFDWVDKEIIPIGSCVTVKQCSFVSRHIHKLYPDRD